MVRTVEELWETGVVYLLPSFLQPSHCSRKAQSLPSVRLLASVMLPSHRSWLPSKRHLGVRHGLVFGVVVALESYSLEK